LFDMPDRRVRRDAVAEIEDVRAATHCRQNIVDPIVERFSAGDETERVEVPL
jgi:hypothetical protein